VLNFYNISIKEVLLEVKYGKTIMILMRTIVYGCQNQVIAIDKREEEQNNDGWSLLFPPRFNKTVFIR
jgi:hypothetical protein